MSATVTRAAECPEYAAWVKHIRDLPLDFTARLVFADWLQDRDDVRAEGWRFTARRILVPTFSRLYGTYKWNKSETDPTGRGVLRGRLWRAVYAAEPFVRRPRPNPGESINSFDARLKEHYDVPENRVGLFDALDAVALAYHTIDERFRGML